MNKIRKIKRIKIKKIKDLSIPEDFSLEKVGITQSLMGMFIDCPRSFLLAINKYYSDSANKNFSFGRIIHFVLDKIYSTGLKNEVKKFLSDYKKENKEKIIGIDIETLQNDINMAQIILTEYIKYYPEDFKNKKFIDVEKEGSCIINGFKINYKIDGKFKDKKRKSIYLKEHKTKSKVVENTICRILTFNFQNLIYLNCEEQSTNKKIDGTLFNIIRKPQIKRKISETEVEFYKRLKEDVKKRPEFYFIRYEIPYTEATKKESIEELKEVLENIKYKIEKCRKTGKNNMFYKNSKSCDSGFYTCTFLDACSSGVLTNYRQKDKLFSELKSIKY